MINPETILSEEKNQSQTKLADVYLFAKEPFLQKSKDEKWS